MTQMLIGVALGYTPAMKQDDDQKPTPNSEHQEIPGGPLAAPDTPEGRDAAREEGEEA